LKRIAYGFLVYIYLITDEGNMEVRKRRNFCHECSFLYALLVSEKTAYCFGYYFPKKRPKIAAFFLFLKCLEEGIS
jgi:hypothetical protein